MLTLQRPIVTKNMCFYGCNVDLNHVPLLTVAVAAEDEPF